MLRGSLFLLFFFYIFSEWGMRKEIALPWLGLWLLGDRGPKQRSLQLLKAYQRRVYLLPTKVAGHWWFNGRILACHVGDPGPIPGQCKDSLLLSRMRACTISKNAQTSGAEAIFVWAQPWRDHSFLRCGYLCSETPTRLFRVYQQAVEGHAAGHFCICSLAVHASCLIFI